MRRLLVITTLDYQREPNQRVHHQVRHLAPAFDQTTVLYLSRAQADLSWRGYVRSMLALQTRCWREDGVTFVRVDPLWNPPWGSNIRYIRFPSILGLVPLSLLIGYLRRVRRTFDVTLAVGPFAAATAYVLKRLGRTKLLVYDDIDFEPGVIRSASLARYVGWLERAAITRADLCVTVGDALGELRHSQTGSQVVVIPNGVDYAVFATAQSKVPHPRTIVYTGNVERRHSGLDLAIRAVARLAPLYPDLQLLIVGSGHPTEVQTLQSLIGELEISDRVLMVGEFPYHDLPQHLRKADIGWAVFPSNHTRMYAFPNKVIEYMAAGLAVLGTAGSQTAHVVQRFECGVVVPFELDAVVDALASLCRDSRSLAQYARNGSRAARGFDWQELMERQGSLILSTLDAGVDGHARAGGT